MSTHPIILTISGLLPFIAIIFITDHKSSFLVSLHIENFVLGFKYWIFILAAVICCTPLNNTAFYSNTQFRYLHRFNLLKLTFIFLVFILVLIPEQLLFWV